MIAHQCVHANRNCILAIWFYRFEGFRTIYASTIICTRYQRPLWYDPTLILWSAINMFIGMDDDDFDDFDTGPLRKRYWDMLLHRSPNLEELCIEGTCPPFTHAHKLTEGRWPKLRQLSLCDIPVDHRPSPNSDNADSKRPFVEFLEAHGDTLQSLSFSRERNIDISVMRTLDQSALCHIRRFAGTVEQLRLIPQCAAKLNSLLLRNAFQSTRDVTSDVLKSITNLKELEIEIPPQQSYESSNLFRAITHGCRGLRCLKIDCTQQATFQFVSRYIPFDSGEYS